MTNKISTLYITDKSGKKFWRTTVATDFAQGERNNLKRHLTLIISGNPSYSFVDRETAHIVEHVA